MKTLNALLASHRRKSAEATIQLLLEHGALIEVPSANGRLVRGTGVLLSTSPSSSIWADIDKVATR